MRRVSSSAGRTSSSQGPGANLGRVGLGIAVGQVGAEPAPIDRPVVSASVCSARARSMAPRRWLKTGASKESPPMTSVPGRVGSSWPTVSSRLTIGQRRRSSART